MAETNREYIEVLKEARSVYPKKSFMMAQFSEDEDKDRKFNHEQNLQQSAYIAGITSQLRRNKIQHKEKPLKIKSKVVEKEAMQFNNNNDADNKNMNEICIWINQGRQGNDGHAWHNGTDIFIHTLEGWHTATCGDWIIRGLKGEFYPCKPDVFNKSYDIIGG